MIILDYPGGSNETSRVLKGGREGKRGNAAETSAKEGVGPVLPASKMEERGHEPRLSQRVTPCIISFSLMWAEAVTCFSPAQHDKNDGNSPS